jgi:hypothetical protein
MMPQLLAPGGLAVTRRVSVRRRTVKAVRPSLIDLRFKGDPWVVDNQDGTAALCLGDYRVLRIDVSPFDVPGLNRTLAQLRLGQARRQMGQRPAPLD